MDRGDVGLRATMAVVFGYKARKEIESSGGTQTGRGMATTGIVPGWIGILGGLTIRIASLDDLMSMKRAAGRRKDLIELGILAALKEGLEK